MHHSGMKPERATRLKTGRRKRASRLMEKGLLLLALLVSIARASLVGAQKAGAPFGPLYSYNGTELTQAEPAVSRPSVFSALWYFDGAVPKEEQADWAGQGEPEDRSADCTLLREGERAYFCSGGGFRRVPSKLDAPEIVILRNTAIEAIWNNSLIGYKDTLRDLSIEGAPKLYKIESGAFTQLHKLRVLYILQAPKLVSLWITLSAAHVDLDFIHVQQSALEQLPKLADFKQEQKPLSSLDLDYNNIATLGEEPINLRAEQLSLEFNRITAIHEFTFNNSEIGALSLKGNRQLTFIHERAFANLRFISKIDLSRTGIQQLPTAGLHQLRALVLRDVFALKQIPSIFDFPLLENAELTYAYHCCSFRHPKSHDPVAYERHVRLQEEINAVCAKTNESGASNPAAVKPPLQENNKSPFGGPAVQSSSADASGAPEFEGYFGVEPARPAVASSLPGAEVELKLWMQEQPLEVQCGELAIDYAARNVACTPEPDAFNPCEDIMGYPVLRFAVWLVVACSLCGNLAVIAVQMGVLRRISVPKLLQLNLAIGDLFMGVYLSMLAAADLSTAGAYFNYAADWQHGLGCQLAGAASLFASQLSIFSLSVLTFERYFTITYSIDLNMRLQLGWATRIMLLGWIYAAGSAALPIFADINSYSKTSICIPMRTSDFADRLFIFVLLAIDSGAFLAIFACYLRMYLLIARQRTEASAKERTVAMRMALLVFTDFACWAPIIFFSLTALLAEPLISVTNSKILVVLFYPLNSMANPFLYVLSTRQYKRDLAYLAIRWRAWRARLFSRNQEPLYSSGIVHLVENRAANVNLTAGTKAAAAHLQQANYKLGLRAARLPSSAQEPKQRIICTKTHQGQFEIQHQIIESPCQTHQRVECQQQVQPRVVIRKLPARRDSDASKLVNVSLRSIEVQNNKLRAACDLREQNEDSEDEAASLEPATTSSTKPCCSKACGLHSGDCLRCASSSGTLDSISSRPHSFEGAQKDCFGPRGEKPAQSGDLRSITLMTPLPNDSGCSAEERRAKLASKEEAPIDILGNLSFNEPTSSVSQQSTNSPPVSSATTSNPTDCVDCNFVARKDEFRSGKQLAVPSSNTRQTTCCSQRKKAFRQSAERPQSRSSLQVLDKSRSRQTEQRHTHRRSHNRYQVAAKEKARSSERRRSQEVCGCARCRPRCFICHREVILVSPAPRLEQPQRGISEPSTSESSKEKEVTRSPPRA